MLVLIVDVSQFTVPVLPKPDCVAPDARDTVPPHLPIVTAEPSTTMGLLAPDPIVVVVPHFLMMFESSETLFILSSFILLAIFYLYLYLIITIPEPPAPDVPDGLLAPPPPPPVFTVPAVPDPVLLVPAPPPPVPPAAAVPHI